MHIAFYSPAWPPEAAASGIVTYVATLRESLVSTGHAVSIVTPQGYVPHGQTQIINYKEGIAWRLGYAKFLSLHDRFRADTLLAAERIRSNFLQLNRLKRVDLIEMEESFGWFSHISRIGIPVVARLHGPHFLSEQWAGGDSDPWSLTRERREGLALRNATFITAPSVRTLSETCSRYDCSASVREVIPNPVVPVGEQLLWSPQVAQSDTLLWVGRFDRAKGADLVLAAFARLCTLNPNARLELVGPDSGLKTEDGRNWSFSHYCEEFIPPAVRQRIVFRGRLSPVEIAQLRQQSALTLVTSRSENFPYAVAEAQAAGAPVLAVRWAGIEEIIEHGRSGWIVSDPSPQVIAEEIQSLLCSPEARREIGLEGWRRSREHLSLEAVTRKLIALYGQVAATRCGGATGREGVA